MYNAAYKRTFGDVLKTQLDFVNHIANDIYDNLDIAEVEELVEYASKYADVVDEDEIVTVSVGEVMAFIGLEKENDGIWFDMSGVELDGDDYETLKHQIEVAEDNGFLEDWGNSSDYESILTSSKPYRLDYDNFDENTSIMFATKR